MEGMRIALGLLLAASMLAAQNANDTPEAHVAIAKTAAGGEVVENRLHADHEMAKLDKPGPNHRTAKCESSHTTFSAQEA